MVKAKSFFKANSKIAVCVLLIVALFIIGNILTGGNFASPAATIKFSSFIAILGLGQMLIISTGGYVDLSVGYCATLVGCITARIMDGQNSKFLLALLVAVAIGCLVGLANGFFSVYLGLPSLVVTLAMSQILQGIVDIYAAGFQIDGQASPMIKALAARSTGIIPNMMIFIIVLTALIMLLLYKTKVGIQLTACGANEVAAYLSGIRVKKVRLMSFVVCDVIACFTGLLLLGNLGIANKDMGSTYVMPSIAAVAIGGLNLNGGDKNYIGVVLGAIVLQTLTNLFVALGYGDSGKWLGYGIILLLMLIAYVREKDEK